MDPSQVKYEENAMTRTVDIKCSSHSKVKNILMLDNRYEVIYKNICKSCRKNHIKGCCEEYNRINRSKAIYIKNCALNEHWVPPIQPIMSNLDKYLIRLEKEKAYRKEYYQRKKALE